MSDTNGTAFMYAPMTGRPAILWRLRLADDGIAECLLEELDTGDLEVVIVKAGHRSHRILSRVFQHPTAALEWAIAEEDRLIAEGWRRWND